MVAVLLMLLAGGVALAQAVSDPRQVTLRWLRLGGIIALCLLAVAFTLTLASGPRTVTAVTVAAVTLPVVVQLVTVQLAWRRTQRVAAAVAWLAASVAAAVLLAGMTPDRVLAPGSPVADPAFPEALAAVLTCLMASGLTGGTVMTMLLGHAYLTAGGQMTQRPFLRLVAALGVLVALRLALSAAAGAWPYWQQASELASLPGYRVPTWDVVMIIARYAVGLIVPGVFAAMAWDCVRRHSNQSATGILYVTCVLLLIGEGVALALFGRTGLLF